MDCSRRYIIIIPVLRNKLPFHSLIHSVFEQHVATIKSDVWSFGVTFWEILEYGLLPYTELSNTQVVTSVRDGMKLPQPSNCPDELYTLMYCEFLDVLLNL